jgi:hypothetical protein
VLQQLIATRTVNATQKRDKLIKIQTNFMLELSFFSHFECVILFIECLFSGHKECQKHLLNYIKRELSSEICFFLFLKNANGEKKAHNEQNTQHFSVKVCLKRKEEARRRNDIM